MSWDKPILTHFYVSSVQLPCRVFFCQAFSLGWRSWVCDLSETFYIYLLSFSLTQSLMEWFLVTQEAWKEMQADLYGRTGCFFVWTARVLFEAWSPMEPKGFSSSQVPESWKLLLPLQVFVFICSTQEQSSRHQLASWCSRVAADLQTYKTAPLV